MPVHRRFVLSLPVMAFGMPAGPAQAQTWPTAKPITIVVPFPPCPALDLVARLVAAKIGPALGHQPRASTTRRNSASKL